MIFNLGTIMNNVTIDLRHTDCERSSSFGPHDSEI